MPTALAKDNFRVPEADRPRDTAASLRHLIEHGEGRIVFQPIVGLHSGEIVGYESLTRLAAGAGFENPSEMFAAAKEHGLLGPLELVCCQAALRAFARTELKGKLFINLSPQTVVDAHVSGDATLELMRRSELAGRVIIELTEQHSAPGIVDLRAALDLLRSCGIRFALDDLGQGFSSLWLWSELKPELVKVDMHFVQGISRDPIKFQFVKSIQQIADSIGAKMIAEGIEDRNDLLVVRDLGIAYGQGYLIAHPSENPPRETPPEVVAALRSRGISVFPEIARLPNGRRITAEKLLIEAAPVSPSTPNDELLHRFESVSGLHAIAVVDEGRPLGLVNRYRFIAEYVRPFHRELYGRRSCTAFMDPQAIVVDKQLSIHELSEVLLGADQRYLSDGFIITDAGRYLGLGTGHDLIREITDMQLDAARYANPLTLLPGNVPIEGHIDRLLATGQTFAAAYCDLNDFKPFNDTYGYRRGDDMIKLTARVLSAACDPRQDFIGHIGGDDFILLFQSADWRERLERALAFFAEQVPFLFDPSDRERGNLSGESRSGQPLVYPLTSLSAGVVMVESEFYPSHLDVAYAAAEAKKQAKRLGGSALFVERRQPT